MVITPHAGQEFHQFFSPPLIFWHLVPVEFENGQLGHGLPSDLLTLHLHSLAFLYGGDPAPLRARIHTSDVEKAP